MLPWILSSCPECGAAYGEGHWPGCGRTTALEELLECRLRGWTAVHVPGEGFRPCRPDEPGAAADLDRYAFWLANGEAALDGREHPLA